MNQLLTTPIGDMVKENYLTADVFKRYGLSYCCGGNVDLITACAVRGLDPAKVQTDLEAAVRPVRLPPRLQLEDWPLPFAIEYVVHVHHGYLRRFLPVLSAGWASFVIGHQKKYPELVAVGATIQELQASVLAALAWEEAVWFPELLARQGMTLSAALRQEVSERQEVIQSYFNALRAATAHYAFPKSACTQHQVVYQQVRELDQAYQEHIRQEERLFIKTEGLN